MHPPMFILAVLVLAPAAAHAEFVMQQAAPSVAMSAPIPDGPAERARLARAYWLRTHRVTAVPA